MTTQTQTLTAFLTQRIDEDERIADSIKADPYGVFKNYGGSPLRWVAVVGDRSWQTGKARVLAECKAKRQIVEMHELEHECAESGVAGGVFDPCTTILALAAVYADHPSFRDEWRA